jgi:hypothetical protein
MAESSSLSRDYERRERPSDSFIREERKERKERPSLRSGRKEEDPSSSQGLAPKEEALPSSQAGAPTGHSRELLDHIRAFLRHKEDITACWARHSTGKVEAIEPINGALIQQQTPDGKVGIQIFTLILMISSHCGVLGPAFHWESGGH